MAAPWQAALPMPALPMLTSVMIQPSCRPGHARHDSITVPGAAVQQLADRDTLVTRDVGFTVEKPGRNAFTP